MVSKATFYHEVKEIVWIFSSSSTLLLPCQVVANTHHFTKCKTLDVVAHISRSVFHEGCDTTVVLCNNLPNPFGWVSPFLMSLSPDDQAFQCSVFLVAIHSFSTVHWSQQRSWLEKLYLGLEHGLEKPLFYSSFLGFITIHMLPDVLLPMKPFFLCKAPSILEFTSQIMLLEVL